MRTGSGLLGAVARPAELRSEIKSAASEAAALLHELAGAARACGHGERSGGNQAHAAIDDEDDDVDDEDVAEVQRFAHAAVPRTTVARG